MKFNQLRDFVAVAEHGSLRAAARTMGLAQPAITRSVQELEHSLGTQLFVREARGVSLTPNGKALLVRARAILEEIRRAGETMRQLQDGVEGELVIGMSIAGHLGILGEVIRPFRNRYPKVTMRLIEGLFPTLEGDLRNGVVDLYVGPIHHSVSVAGLHVQSLFENKRVVLGRKNHPLGGARALSQLAQASWMTTSITHDASDELEQVFAEHGLGAPNLVCQCQSALSILTMLANTDMLAMVPIQWVGASVFGDRLEQVPLLEQFAAPPIVYVYRAGLQPTPAAEYFTHLVQMAASKLP